jgi:hypothetical protein
MWVPVAASRFGCEAFQCASFATSSFSNRLTNPPVGLSEWRTTMKKVLAIAGITVGLGIATVPASAQGYVTSGSDRPRDARPAAGMSTTRDAPTDKGSSKNAICGAGNAVWQCRSDLIRWQ